MSSKKVRCSSLYLCHFLFENNRGKGQISEKQSGLDIYSPSLISIGFNVFHVTKPQFQLKFTSTC
jgi:hypothetical protein